MSIRKRITVWFAMTVLLLSAVFIAVSYTATLQITENAIREKLSETAVLAAKIVKEDSQEGGITTDGLSDITGAQILLLGKDGEVYYGKAIKELVSLRMTDKTFQSVTISGYHYYVYDRLVMLGDQPGKNGVWVRACVSLSILQLLGSSMLRVWGVLVPVLLLLSVLTGYLLTGRAFRPIAGIGATAREIAQSGDLTKRIATDGMHQDELYELSQTFNEMFDRLQSSFESEKQFTSDASHELRTPVAVIMAQAEYLAAQEEKTVKTADTLKAAQVILEQSRRMSRLIQELLMISRMENDKIVLRREEVDAGELAEMVVLELEEQAAQKNITLQTQVPQPVLLQTDQTMLMRVFMNLITNGIKYGREGGFVKVSVGKDEDGKVTCSVADNGIGIAQEQQEKIWQRFYQVNPARTSDGSGSGLGLFMVKWIVEHEGGSIRVDSREGEGSTFTFTL